MERGIHVHLLIARILMIATRCSYFLSPTFHAVIPYPAARVTCTCGVVGIAVGSVLQYDHWHARYSSCF